MNNRTISEIVAILLIATILVTSFGTNPVKAVSAAITVPDDYSTIQEAINHASDGDTIFVKAGTYIESVIINRTISLLGENRETTIIQGAAYPIKYGVLVTSDNVTFKGFTVCKSGWSGIQVQSSGCHISDSNFSKEDEEGIFLDGRNAQVNDNVVANNIVLNNYDAGILVWTSNGNHIESNTLGDNTFGMYIEETSSRNMIERNEIFSESAVGIVLADSFGNTIECNNISDCGWPNRDFGYSAISILSQSVGNRIVANLIRNNRRGVFLGYFSNNNVFYHNSFINNFAQVIIDNQFPSLCTWDGGYSQGGNYWSDYNGIDVKKGPYQNETGSDGVADSPYIIDVYNQDRYPLMKPYAPMFGDCNGDGVINLEDAMIVALAFGTSPGSAKWNPLADVNKDGTVNLEDLFAVYIRFGKTYIPQ